MRLLPLLLTIACQTATPSVKPATELAWLEGTWQSTHEGVVTTEAWHALPDGTLLGTGHARTPKITLFSETMAVSAEGTSLTFVAWPAGQTPVPYTQTASGENTTTFSNPSHDFPSSLTYTRKSPTELDVKAMGKTPDGKPREESWTLTKVP